MPVKNWHCGVRKVSRIRVSLKKIKQIITDLLDRLRAYFKNVEPDSLAAKEFAKIDANAKQILADMFVDMSIDAGEKLSAIKEAGLQNKAVNKQEGKQYKIPAASGKNFKNGQNAKGEFIANILIDLADSNSEWWTGRYNRGILSMSKMDDTEFRQFYQEVYRRTKDMKERGENRQTVVTDSFVVHDDKGREYIYVVELDGYLHGVVLEKIDFAKYTKAMKRYEGGSKNGRSYADIDRRIGSARVELERHAPRDSRSITPGGPTGFGRVGNKTPQSNNAGYAEGKSTTNQTVYDTTESNNIGRKNKLPVSEDTPPRTLLANAFEGVAQNEIEKQKVQEYKSKIELLEAQEKKLSELNAQIKELSFAEGNIWQTTKLELFCYFPLF